MKRRYKVVEVTKAGDGFGIALDGKPMRTPAGHPFVAPTRALADAIAAEWQAQGEKVNPRSMPMTQFIATAIDRVSVERERIVGDLAAFAETDLLCHRAEEAGRLAARQQEHWQPLLDWAADALAARFALASGVMPVAQPPETLAAIRARIAGLDDLMLVALQTLAGASGSIVLALAVLEGRLAAEEAHRLSRLDEDYQIERWGEDYEAADRRAAVHADMLATAQLLSLARVRH
jgi:chaperone required for assembly of F1-ATPase